MHRFLAVSLSCASLFAAVATMPGAAAAKPARHVLRRAPRVHVARYAPSAYDAHYIAPPLTVRRRSFLDPGNVVPVGSENHYVTDSTIFNRTPDQIYARSKFGNETLPGPFDLPGRQEPILEFSTGGY